MIEKLSKQDLLGIINELPNDITFYLGGDDELEDAFYGDFPEDSITVMQTDDTSLIATSAIPDTEFVEDVLSMEIVETDSYNNSDCTLDDILNSPCDESITINFH